MIHLRTASTTPQQINNLFLQYFTKFTEVALTVKTVKDFSDGLLIIDILKLISDFTFISTIEEKPCTFSHRFTNLKIIYGSIDKFWREILGCEIEGEDIDFVEIAHTGKE
jgi:hypothetical protein